MLIALAVFAWAHSPASLIGAIVLFQFTLNMLFSPIGALLADKVPHSVKGRMAAVLNLGMPMGTLMIAALTLPFFTSERERLIALAIVIAALVTPLLFTAHRQPNLEADASAPESFAATFPSPTHDLAWAWIARFSVQISGAVIFGYILYFLQDILFQSEATTAVSPDQALGQMSLAATPVAIVAGLSAGFVSDRLMARKAILLLAAGMVAAALWVMVIWPNWPVTFAAYIVFSAGLTAYLTIDAAIVTQLLARSASRGRTLGIMNLTNTLPAILTPALALALNSASLSQSELIPLMQFAAVLAIIGALAATRIRTVG